MEMKTTETCLIAGAEILRVQGLEQLNGSLCHVVLGLQGFPTETKSAAKGVTCGTEWSFSLITVCTMY